MEKAATSSPIVADDTVISPSSRVEPLLFKALEKEVKVLKGSEALVELNFTLTSKYKDLYCKVTDSEGQVHGLCLWCYLFYARLGVKKQESDVLSFN